MGGLSHGVGPVCMYGWMDGCLWRPFRREADADGAVVYPGRCTYICKSDQCGAELKMAFAIELKSGCPLLLIIPFSYWPHRSITPPRSFTHAHQIVHAESGNSLASFSMAGFHARIPTDRWPHVWFYSYVRGHDVCIHTASKRTHPETLLNDRRSNSTSYQSIHTYVSSFVSTYARRFIPPTSLNCQSYLSLMISALLPFSIRSGLT